MVWLLVVRVGYLDNTAFSAAFVLLVMISCFKAVSVIACVDLERCYNIVLVNLY